jgi:hypothetical protein
MKTPLTMFSNERPMYHKKHKKLRTYCRFAAIERKNAVRIAPKAAIAPPIS